ncbi:26S protease regulatory subunit 6A [Tripterygium wilfordii]|uniref:26S protease regulatory subunit 6A n=1 Tax=Tripterygium wilfordii TaxID=458696 RepID=A0A7J7DJC6_TRIWF|nr:26S protease regulatory subunit 6A [Tripterygium wilfordii]
MFFSVSDMPSTPSVLSAYTSVAALLMLVRTVFNEVQTMISKFLPQKLRENLLLRLGEIFGSLCSQMTVLISEYNGLSVNEIYQASETYLSSRITPSINELKVFKAQREKNISVTINKGEKVFDIFEGIQLVWEFVSTETQKSHFDYDNYSHTSETTENRSFRLSFNKRYKEVVLRAYLPYVVERSKAIKEENKALKLYSLGSLSGDYDAELMKYENVDIALKGVTAFIERKKLMKCNENTAEERKDVVVEQEKESEGFQGKCDSKVRKNQRKMAKKGKEG